MQERDAENEKCLKFLHNLLFRAGIKENVRETNIFLKIVLAIYSNVRYNAWVFRTGTRLPVCAKGWQGG